MLIADPTPRIAVTMGRTIETAEPKVSSRITRATAIPIASLVSVAGGVAFCPSWPPAATSRPAASIGFWIRSTIRSASSAV